MITIFSNPDLKPTWINMLGSCIEILDAETGESLESFPIPQKGKPGLWTGRVVKKMAARGYDVRTMPSMAGGDARSIAIGGAGKYPQRRD